jgi:hypothetical protein
VSDPVGLRGEPCPDGPEPPGHAYRWVRNSTLELAATVTIVTGSTTAAVLRAFGADPDRPEPLRDAGGQAADHPRVMVLEAGPP